MPFTFKISSLLDEKNASQQAFEVKEKAPFSNLGFNLASPVTGTITLERVSKDILSYLDLTVDAEFVCQRCLKKYISHLKFSDNTYVFYRQKPPYAKPTEEIHLIDPDNMTIDLTAPIRQEIILSAPFTPLCKRSCKGLCSHCGQDLNKKKCSCDALDKGDKSLSQLKDLVKKHKTR